MRKRTFTLPARGSELGAPILIKAGQLKRDEKDGSVLAYLALESASDMPIVRTEIELVGLDADGRMVGEPILYRYRDKVDVRGRVFGKNQPIVINDLAVVSYEVSVKQVIFEDGNKWPEIEAEKGTRECPLQTAETNAAYARLLPSFLKWWRGLPWKKIGKISGLATGAALVLFLVGYFVAYPFVARAFGDYRPYVNFYNVKHVDIPEGKNEIRPLAFHGCDTLESVTIPDSVTSIGNSAFYGCQNLADVEIPDSVTSIGSWAFGDCDSLVSIVIPDSVTSIGDSAFLSCNALESITLSESLTSIPEAMFQQCDRLAGIKIPDGVISIGQTAFESCSALATLTLPDSLESIGHQAFARCTSLTAVAFPKSLKTIDYQAFYGCTAIESMELLSPLESQSDYVFGDAHNPEKYALKELTVSAEATKGIASLIKAIEIQSVIINSGESIAVRAFGDCNSLKRITIPEGVESIGEYAFVGCILESLEIPASVTEVSETLFGTGVYASKRLDTLIVQNASVSGLSALINRAKVENLVIKGGDSIPDGALSGCKTLKSITLPEGLSGIGKNAFSGCSDLVSIVIPESVTSIGEYAFSGCSKLEGILLPDGVTEIAEGVFNSCSSLTEIVLPAGVVSIGDNAFRYCYRLTDISLPEGLVRIGESAFELCHALTSLVIPTSVTEVGNHIFGTAVSEITLESLTIPTTAISGIAGTQKSNKPKIKSVIVTGSGSIPDQAFWGCRELESVVISDGVTGLGKEAFRACNKLTSITLPEGVMSIGPYAFYECYSVFTEIVIPASVTSIGYGAFSSCDALRDVYFAGSEAEWAAIEIAGLNDRLNSVTIHYNNVPAGE